MAQIIRSYMHRICLTIRQQRSRMSSVICLIEPRSIKNDRRRANDFVHLTVAFFVKTIMCAFVMESMRYDFMRTANLAFVIVSRH